MLRLSELQRHMRKAIQTKALSPELDKAICIDGLPVEARMQIYQNNFTGILVENLFGIFPLVSAFVGEDYTKSALRHFIDKVPPTDARLIVYGEDFASFLTGYEHAGYVAYIADIARLEWSIHALQHASEESFRPCHYSGLNENHAVIDSDYPLLNLWMVGAGQLKPESVHIDQGGQFVVVVLHQGAIQLYALNNAEREALAGMSSGVSPADEVALQSLKAKHIII